MIERIAKAAAAEFMRQSAAGDILAFDYVESTTSMDAGCQLIEGEANLRAMARAVLTAIREPTEAMERAVRTMSTDSYSHSEMFTAMVDAALQDGA
jgi:hypothetical protein